MKFRFEQFGGIIAGDNPPFLAMVDRQFMREQGLGPSPLWQGEEAPIDMLSAPTEVHFACTNACSGGCSHCYMGAGPAPEPEELDTSAMKRAFDALAEMGVFHVALGGGDALLRNDLFDLAAHARECGLVPNLTLSGNGLTPEKAERLKVFGQVNISLDGIDDHYHVFRGGGSFETADRALDLLVAAGVPAGINCVLGAPNFDGLPELFDYAARKSLNEIECLRYKPSGRGAADYARRRCTDEQHRRLVPKLIEESKRTGVTAKIDCSFVPMLCAGDPPKELLEAMATYGCEAGNVLLGIRSNGRVSCCSFLETDGLDGLSVMDLPDAFDNHPGLDRFRLWHRNAPAPCDDCPYLTVCKGGCRAVSAHVTGNPMEPDPECPRVIRHSSEGSGS